MVGELESPEVLAAALQPIIYMINRSTMEQFQQYILPFIKNIFQMPKSVQVNIKKKKKKLLFRSCSFFECLLGDFFFKAKFCCLSVQFNCSIHCLLISLFCFVLIKNFLWNFISFIFLQNEQ